MRVKERKLIKKVKAGDDEALEKLFVLYKPLVNSVVKSITWVIMIAMIGNRRP